MQAGTHGLYFDESIPLESRSSINSSINARFSNEANKVIDHVNSDAEVANRVIAGDCVAKQLLQSGDLVLQFNVPVTETAIDCTVAAATDPYGQIVTQATATSTAMNFQLTYGNPLAGLAVGDYTAVFHVELQNAPVQMGFLVADVPYGKSVEIGHNIVSIPFSVSSAAVGAAAWVSGHAYSAGDVVQDTDGFGVWICKVGGTSAAGGNPPDLFSPPSSGPGYVGTDANGVTWAWVTGFTVGTEVIGAVIGTAVGIGRVRILRHHAKVDCINTRILGSAPPASGQWFAGDVVENSVPIAGDFMGWVCTASGSPGTWKGFGQIAT